MSKMGIATVDSYCGAQIFDVLGLAEEVVERYFPGTPARLGGLGLRDLAADVLAWHHAAFPDGDAQAALDSYGLFKFKRDGEYHAYNPDVVRALHEVVGIGKVSSVKGQVSGDGGNLGELEGEEGNGTLSAPRSSPLPARLSSEPASQGPRPPLSESTVRYAELVQRRPVANLRDLLDFASRREPVALDEVEPAEAILRRFSSAAMSHGALSGITHETLAIAMNRLGGASNSGEGGEDEARFGDERNSKIKQVASGRFGVTPAYLMAAEELQIKMAQGSKPGEGGQLPGHKVTEEIARLRHSTPGVALISPPPHHDIYSIEDLAQLIFDLKQVNPEAAVSVKLVSEAGVGTVAAGVAKGHADLIHLSGADGGTGASPLSSIKHAGGPWELGLAETQHTLLTNGLRGRVRIRVDGGFQTGRDVVIGAMLGADEFSFGTAALIAVGCKMARSCHTNTCPVGVATPARRPDRQVPRPAGAPDGLHAPGGRGGAPDPGQPGLPLAERGHRPRRAADPGRHRRGGQPSGSAVPAVDARHRPAAAQRGRAQPAAGGRGPGRPSGRGGAGRSGRLRPARAAALRHRQHRPHCGHALAGQLAKRYGNAGLPAGSIVVELEGTAGQSLGAFLCNGIHLHLTGQANDYVGKGLGGGEIVLRPQAKTQYTWHENVILGNTALYGATGGALFAAGRAGERFAVRNSGANAVVEGVGDHGCEYMTGGVVVDPGRDRPQLRRRHDRRPGLRLRPGRRLPERYNPQLIALRRVQRREHEKQLRTLLRQHIQLTGSPRAKEILDDWDAELGNFWLVLPKDAVAAIEAVNEGAEKVEK